LPNVPNKGFTVDTGGEGSDDACVGDVLEFILASSEALYVIMEAFTGLAFAPQEVPRGTWLSVSPLKVITECLLEVCPSPDRAFPKAV
jgi:hypothetical protein